VLLFLRFYLFYFLYFDDSKKCWLLNDMALFVQQEHDIATCFCNLILKFPGKPAGPHQVEELEFIQWLRGLGVGAEGVPLPRLSSIV